MALILCLLHQRYLMKPTLLLFSATVFCCLLLSLESVCAFPAGNAPDPLSETQHKTLQRRLKPLKTASFSGTRLTAQTNARRSKYFRHFRVGFRKAAPHLSAKTTSDCIPNSLHALFFANSDSLIDLSDTARKLKGLAHYLKNNKNATVTLTGNTGTDPGDKTAPLGSDSCVLSYPATLNGKITITSQLMIARAEVIKHLLETKFHIARNTTTLKHAVVDKEL